MKKTFYFLQVLIIFFTLQGIISCQNPNQIVEKVYTYGIELNIKNESSSQKSVKLITLIHSNENSTWQELKSAQITIPSSETKTLNVSNTIQPVGYDYSFLVQIDDEYKFSGISESSYQNESGENISLNLADNNKNLAWLSGVVEKSDASILKGHLSPSNSESKDYSWKLDFTVTLQNENQTISFDKFYY